MHSLVHMGPLPKWTGLDQVRLSLRPCNTDCFLHGVLNLEKWSCVNEAHDACMSAMLIPSIRTSLLHNYDPLLTNFMCPWYVKL